MLPLLAPLALIAISGTVRDRHTGLTLPEAEVILESGEHASPRHRHTGADGRYAFDGVAAGVQSLRATRAGYVSEAPVRIEAEAGDTTRDFSMEPEGTIAGRIVTSEGLPAANVWVRAFLHGEGGRMPLVWQSEGRTSSEGNYRITGFPSGYYKIGAFPPRPRTFFPGVDGWRAAAPVRVWPGGTALGSDFALREALLYQIRLDFDPPDVAPNCIWILRDEAGVDLEGHLTVEPGRYTVRATCQMRNGEKWGGLTEFDVTTGLVAVTVHIRPWATARVDVRWTDSRTPSSVDLFHSPAHAGEFDLLPVIRNRGEPGIHSLHAPAERRWLRFFSLDSGSYLQSASSGSTDLLRAPIDLTSGSASSATLVLSPNAASVSGHVRKPGGQPADGAAVLLPPDPSLHSHPDSMRTARTSPGGQYSIGGLAPGTYLMLAAETSALPDPAAFTHPNSRALRLRISEGARETADLVLTGRDP